MGTGTEVFCCDLDNTLIYSYKQDIGKKKRCVEVYQGRKVSFVSQHTYELLVQAAQRFLFVPVTTRTAEQYSRICLGIGQPRYALVCNGGILLADGEEDAAWYAQSLKLVGDSAAELQKAEFLLEKDRRRIFEVRNIRGLFVFTKCMDAKGAVADLREKLDVGRVDVLCHGVKVYIVPKGLNKGKAVERFRKNVFSSYIIAAGDSVFDIPMLRKADLGIAPECLARQCHTGNVIGFSEERLFSEQLLEYILSERLSF